MLYVPQTQIQLTKSIVNKVQKPVRVKIPHPMFSVDGDDHSICLFCKSEDKEAIESYLEAHPIQGLNKVVSMNEVKKSFKEFKDKKKLLSGHSHFLCHTSVARQLYNNLGSVFSERNNFPVQVSFEQPSELNKAVAKAVSSSYMHLAGNNICIKLGKTSMTPTEITENIMEGIPFAVEKFQNGWSDVHTVHLKTKDSASLPIYSKHDNELLNYVKQKSAETKEKKATGNTQSNSTKASVTGKRARAEESAPVVEPETDKKAKKAKAPVQAKSEEVAVVDKKVKRKTKA